jgi:chromosome segregation ATPase
VLARLQADLRVVTEDGQKAAEAAAAEHDMALVEAASFEKRCREAEAKLKAHAEDARSLEEQKKELEARKKTLNDRDAELKHGAQEQATEGTRLEKLKEEAEAAQRSLTVAKEAASMERDAFVSLEERLRAPLRSLYGTGYEEPLATPEEGPAGLLRKLVAPLEGVAIGLDPLLDNELHDFGTLIAMRVYRHLYLRYPDFDFGTLLASAAPELPSAAAETMMEQVEALLKQFRPVDPKATAERARIDGDDGRS